MDNTNSYYNRGTDFNPDELADGDSIEAEFDSIQRGMSSIEAALNQKVSLSEVSKLDAFAELKENIRAQLKIIATENGYNLVGGSFQEGAISSGFSDVVLDWNTAKFYQWHLDENKKVPAGSTPATTGGIGAGAWVDRTQETLRSDLAADGGSGLSGFSHSESYGVGTSGAKLKQIVSVTDAPFNAVSGVDSTYAIDAAASAAQFVFVPEGQFISTNASLAYWKFFGFGSLLVGNTLVELSPYPQNGSTGKFYKERTFGNRENACAISIVANGTSGQAKENASITGATTDYLASTYQSFDHVAEYVAAHGFQSTITNAASTTYTSNSVTAPEITDDSVKVGMYLYTQHATGYVGKVLSVSGNTATVDGWYLWGTGTTGIPASATGVKINPNTKIWSKNINLFLDSTSDATSGAGIELGLIINKVGAGANTWGYDCVTLSSSETPYAHFISRGAKTHGFLSLTNGVYGFAAEANQVGFESRNPTVAAFRALISGATKWQVNSSGIVDRDYRKFKAVNVAAYSVLSDDNFLYNVYGNAVITMISAAAVGAHRVYRIKAGALCSVVPATGLIDGAASKSITAGVSYAFISDGTNWYTF